MALEATQAMDLTQAMHTLKWLDEERRKDKATMAALEERLQGQEQQMAQRAAQIQELQTALAGIHSVLSKVKDFEQIVSIYKNELILQMDQRDETRRKEQTEAEQLRRIEREALTAHMHRLEKELRILLRYDEVLNAQRAEAQRLSETLQHMEVSTADLSKRIEEASRTVVYLEEQRRADNRRIVELEQETTASHQRIEALASKFPLLEEALQKQRVRTEDAIQEMKKYEKPIEELRISDFQREQKMKQYMDQGEQVAQELERIRAQTQGFLEQQQLVKRALSALEKFRVRIERRQDEMAEKQRLGEEQMQQRWEEWQTKQAKEQKKREVIVEERWRRQEQINDEHLKRLDAIASVLKRHQAQLDALWEIRRADATHLLRAAQDLYEALSTSLDEQLATLGKE